MSPPYHCISFFHSCSVLPHVWRNTAQDPHSIAMAKPPLKNFEMGGQLMGLSGKPN